ncbi:hypothetical protein [Prosthecobacter sp.]|uniref:hypothetical protein n=1 Tax=Prosthecobacter sp. TaxID=1965333 RepID=UPI0037838B4E
MNTAPAHIRIFHQGRTEWLHQRGMILAWLLWLVARRWHRVHEAKTTFSSLALADLEPGIEVGSLLLAAAVVWRCVSADAPSNAETFSLARPVGQAALWLGKLLFLVLGLVLPAVVVCGLDWRGFGLGVGQWLALSGTVMLVMGLIFGFAGALTALASSTRQMLALAVLGMVGAGVWLAMQGEVYHYGEQIPQEVEQQHASLCGTFVAALTALGGLLVAWWFATVPRRRILAAGLALLTLAAAPLIARAWRYDWITPPPLEYAKATKIGIKVGKADKEDKAPGRGLWPTLRLTGLGKDEVASILEFAPIDDSGAWPPKGSYSDLTVDEGGRDSWLHTDHTRALFKYSRPTTLWRQTIGNNAMYNGRRPLPAVLQQLRLKREDAITRRWRLRLVVHEMKRAATLPYREFWSQENSFLIRPGLRMEFNAFAWLRGAWEMHGRAHRLSAAVLPVESHRSAHVRGRDLSDNFLFVLEDPDLGENEALDPGLVQRARRFSSYNDQSRLWQVDENQGLEIRLWEPKEQEAILKTTREDWVNRLNASLWHAEERGTMEIELTPEQMAEVLAEPEPKTEVKKP